jgi:RNA polymerase sigma factor (sigma-70 family)
MSPRLLRACKYFLGYYDADTEDIVQETFVIALGKMKDYTFDAPIYAWLRQICLRQCYGRMRTRKRLMATVEKDIEFLMMGGADDRAQKEADDLRQKERLEMLQKIKKCLSPDGIEIIELKYVRGLSYTAISLHLNIPLGTVMSRLARNRDQIRALANSGEFGEQAA